MGWTCPSLSREAADELVQMRRQVLPLVTRANLIAEARALRSSRGENPHYDRALCELIYWAAGGVSLTDVAREIGVRLRPRV